MFGHRTVLTVAVVGLLFLGASATAQVEADVVATDATQALSNLEQLHDEAVAYAEEQQVVKPLDPQQVLTTIPRMFFRGWCCVFPRGRERLREYGKLADETCTSSRISDHWPATD
eukprot:CAMPEP_0117648626 /NCGR_PEP_ID=MMETSP0804-20121206/514_1 /TAXON_ID=1074897 /ORGANISM="Tetraselmis astigmatica, Strain CCMP880" /LENGTH=114 /DNA_ID=CAMNT_0005454259 /DNA_START=137 /DNA_END=481 /DNA_ORIENTATION=+